MTPRGKWLAWEECPLGILESGRCWPSKVIAECACPGERTYIPACCNCFHAMPQPPVPAAHPSASRLPPPRPRRPTPRRNRLSQTLARSDLVAFDSGYYCLHLLHAHAERGVHAVFRLGRKSNSSADDLLRSDKTEALITARPSRADRGRHAHVNFRSCRLRFARYTTGAGTTTICTTLLNQRRNPVGDLAGLYHSSRGIEALSAVSDKLIHERRLIGQSLLAVKQELFARFGLFAMKRLAANRQ